jgi:midasin
MAKTNGELPFWLAAGFDIAREVRTLEQEVQRQTMTAKNSKLSSLNRLQRSMVVDRVAAVAKDSTAGASKFLGESISAVYYMLQSAAGPHATDIKVSWKVSVKWIGYS